jgi:predicted RNA-binding Zn-ribbon protein involved in translation (DUF1610 family)
MRIDHEIDRAVLAGHWASMAEPVRHVEEVMPVKQPPPVCKTCNDLGFIKDNKGVVRPCPKCNEDGEEEISG